MNRHDVTFIVVAIGLCESSFLLLEYSIEYSMDNLEVAINHRVVQNKRISDSSFKFVV